MQKLSRKTIWKRTKFYLDTGKVERIAWGVFQKAGKKLLPPPTKPAEDVTPLPIMLPHKFGATFKQTGRPNLPYDKYGKAYDKIQNSYSAQFGRYKTQIWLFSGFEGNTVERLVYSGRLKLIALGKSLAEKYKINLTLQSFYDDIEWVDISKERSKLTARGAKIRKGEFVKVAGVLHKYDKHSQNGHIEFNKAPDENPALPTEHAKIREYIYSGKLASDLYAIKEVLKELQDGQVAIRQRMELEAKR